MPQCGVRLLTCGTVNKTIFTFTIFTVARAEDWATCPFFHSSAHSLAPCTPSLLITIEALITGTVISFYHTLDVWTFFRLKFCHGLFVCVFYLFSRLFVHLKFHQDSKS